MTQSAETSHRVFDVNGHPTFWMARLFDREHSPIWVNVLTISSIGPPTTWAVVDWAKSEVVNVHQHVIGYDEREPEALAEWLHDELLRSFR